jgi:hypothetical protein
MGSMKVLLALCVVWCACLRLVLELNSLFALLPALVLSVCLLAFSCGPSDKGLPVAGREIFINGEYRGYIPFPPGSRMEIRSNAVYLNGKLFAKGRFEPCSQ